MFRPTNCFIVFCVLKYFGVLGALCPAGLWGDGCTSRCGHCLGRPCHATSGACQFGCASGYKHTLLCQNECHDGDYGPSCAYKCNFNCDGICEKTNGTCSKCKAGWIGDMCEEECPVGHFGMDCAKTCSENCQGGVQSCSRTNGRCLLGCAQGWTGEQCKEQCPEGTWGVECRHRCGHCRATSCKQSDGKCEHGCLPGYKTTFHCDEECQAGFYGEACVHKCSQHCMDFCNHVDGTCTRCKAGWKGKNCTKECEFGEWGEHCKETCGHCAAGKTCDRFNGRCIDGCIPGYLRTDLCLQECADLTYGEECLQKCSPNCVDVCKKENGTCEYCSAGWKGLTCDTECDIGEWGLGCILRCGKCSGPEGCDRFTGKCQSVCMPGYYTTESCEQECKERTYGINCEGVCSPNCLDVCSRVDGTCNVCANGWKGSDCNTEMIQSNQTKNGTTEPEASSEEHIMLPLPIVWKTAIGVGGFIFIVAAVCLIKRYKARKATKTIESDPRSDIELVEKRNRNAAEEASKPRVSYDHLAARVQSHRNTYMTLDF